MVAIGVAAAGHAIAAGTTEALGLMEGWGGFGQPPSPREKVAIIPLNPSCDGDAVLAAAARITLCATPFVDDVAACLIEVRNRLESDRLRCHVDELPSVAVNLTPIDVTRLEQIDPEPLLEELSAERQQAFEQKQEELQVALQQQAEQRRTQIARDQQVVEIAKPTVEVAPDNARFVADHDSKVEKQTVARGSNMEEIAARSKHQSLEVKENPREAGVDQPPDPGRDGNPEAPRLPGKLSMRAPGAEHPAETAQEAHTRGVAGGDSAPIGDGMRARRGDGLISSVERRPSTEPSGQGGAGGGTPHVPDLRPSEQVLERALGGGSVDHLDDVESGEETALNTKQWVFASFFNRMKRRVHQNWDPVSVWARHDPTGQVYGFKTRVTRVRVTLNPGGDLTKIIVSKSSGVDLLDDEAVRAFRAAQPFPNPPVGLIDASGQITFEFGFHLEIGGGRKAEWKIFRSL